MRVELAGQVLLRIRTTSGTVRVLTSQARLGYRLGVDHTITDVIISVPNKATNDPVSRCAGTCKTYDLDKESNLITEQKGSIVPLCLCMSTYMQNGE